MEILGKVGVDIKLLIAQIINFGLLLWLLKKFLYAPIVKRIEKDEREINEAKIQKEKLEKEKEQFQKQKTKELAEARKKAKDIIAEAHHLAGKIEKKAKEKIEKEKRAAISQAKEHLKTLEPAFKAQLNQSAREEIVQKLRQYFLSLPQQAQKSLQEFFWQDLLKQTENLDLARAKTAAAAVWLKYVYPASKNHLANLESMLSKKIGAKITLADKLNKDLISGFRLEVSGVIIESNLLNQINNGKTNAI